MVLTLLESGWKTGKKRLFGVGFASLAIHSAMIAGVVYATPHAAPRGDQVRMGTTVVLLAPQEQQTAAEPPPAQLADALQGFQTVAVSAQIPIDMPPVDLQQRFDPKDYSGSGVEGSWASGIVVSGNEVYAEALVEERPALLSAPAPVYPALLRQAGIQGRVILPAVIDTTGRIEPASVRIMKSPHPAFDQPTKDWLLNALFRPARLHGRCSSTCSSTTRSRRRRARTRSRHGRPRSSAEGRTRTCTGVASQGILSRTPPRDRKAHDDTRRIRTKQLGGPNGPPLYVLYPRVPRCSGTERVPPPASVFRAP